jgi:hypothetical protein
MTTTLDPQVSPRLKRPRSVVRVKPAEGAAAVHPLVRAGAEEAPP